MTRYKAHLKSLTPISFGAYISAPKKRGENPQQYEEAHWRERCNVDDKGNETSMEEAMKATPKPAKAPAKAAKQPAKQ